MARRRYDIKKAINTAAADSKTYKTYEEIRELIKEFFNMKSETLTKDELKRTVKAYIYLTDDRIPVNAAMIRKRSK